ncbi:MAG TPA: methyltransferase domain-containing protein [Ilumatobacter sp.]|nr:methyltransferase domain-containing protein [Ilumatobacter sp.]
MNPNQGQVEAWNGGESVHYVNNAERYDRQLARFSDVLLDRARITGDDTVLDVGCGCGITTLRAAQSARRALGLDISHPLVDIATERAGAAGASNVEFIVADAQTHGLGEGEFTMILSQFGLMFFDDPEGAFSNLRRSLTSTGRLLFVCWQELDSNEWLAVVARAVAEHVDIPEFGGRSGGPGMFALKRPDETTELLEAAGYTQVLVEPILTTVLLAGGGNLDDSIDFLLGMGMVRGLLGRLDRDTRETAIADIRSDLAERYEAGVGVTLGAAGWLVSARNAPPV